MNAINRFINYYLYYNLKKSEEAVVREDDTAICKRTHREAGSSVLPCLSEERTLNELLCQGASVSNTIFRT